SFTVSTVALAAGLWVGSAASGGTPFAGFGASVLMLLPALAGMALGQALRSRLSPALFRRCFLASLALLGGYMVAHGLEAARAARPALRLPTPGAAGATH